MPRRCVVPGCDSNYDSYLKSAVPVSTFSFPKNETRKTAWLHAIPRKDWTPSASSAVCIKHFAEKHVVTSTIWQKANDKTDETNKLLLSHPKLTEDAVPSIFPNLPKYLSRVEPTKRRSPDDRHEEVCKRNAESIEHFLKNDIISSFDDFLISFADRLSRLTKWNYKNTEAGVWFYILSIESDKHYLTEDHQLKISSSVFVSSELVVKVFLKENEIPAHDLKWLFCSDLKLKRWSQLENLLIRYQSDKQSNEGSNESAIFLSKAEHYLTKCLTTTQADSLDNRNLLEIIKNQISLIISKKKIYSPTTLLFAFLIYSQSATTYNVLKEYLILPHKRHLQSIAASLHINPNQEVNTTNYLTQVVKLLTERDLYVSLLIDEIYINQSLTFKAQNVVGFAENNSSVVAKTVLSFMLTSCFGGYKDIVRLIPVSGLTGELLKKYTMEVIQYVQKFHFKVTIVISDNNRVNQSMFLLFAEIDYFIQNPDFPIPIFLSFDFVHILKNIRNNWLNLRKNFSSFLFPDFEDYSIIRGASFDHLRQFYNMEKDMLIKKAYKLNAKTLFPNNLERQNVALVDNIFHHSTIAALKEVEEYAETVMFLKVIRKWWDIVNTKTTFKGVIKRNEWSGPIYSCDDKKYLFLKKFVDWIKKWKDLCNKKKCVGLSKDTFNAIERSTVVLLELIAYALKNYPVQYVLPGKFQTDNLEGRFGRYRTLSGCNYNVSFQQLLESEKKIRVRKILEIVKDNKMSLKEIVDDGIQIEVNFSDLNINEFICIFSSNYLEICEVDQATTLYLCGSASRSVFNKTPCSFCKKKIIESKGDEVGCIYFDELQRGGLCLPTDFVITIFFHMIALFQFIVNNADYNRFFKHHKQKVLLMALTNQSLQNSNFFNSADENDCECENKLATKFYPIFSNVLLNNFTKVNNDTVQTCKKRKIQTYK